MHAQISDQIDLEKNKKTYIQKMTKELRDIEDDIHRVAKTINSNNSKSSGDFRKSIEMSRNKLSELHRRFDALKNESPETWAEQSRVVSNTYKELEDLVNSLKTSFTPV